MSSLTSYNGLSVITPEPSATGGKAINDNFKALSTPLHTANPAATNDSSQGFFVGSRWFNTSTEVEWICTNNAVGAAVWQSISASASQWTTSGSSIYYNGGNVGIGTSTPSYSLHIAGTANQTFFVQSNNTLGTAFEVQNTSSGGGDFQLAVTGQYNAYGVGSFLFWDQTHSRAPFLITSAGNVRVGNVANSGVVGSQFSVSGNVSIGSTDYASAAPTDGLLVQGNTIVQGNMTAATFIATPQSSAPSSPVAGQIYFNSSSGHFFGWNGSAWKQLDD